MNDDIGLRIRVDDVLRREFIDVCKAKDTTAAQVLRAYMRTYVEQHGEEALQHSLFQTTSPDRRPISG